MPYYNRDPKRDPNLMPSSVLWAWGLSVLMIPHSPKGAFAHIVYTFGPEVPIEGLHQSLSIYYMGTWYMDLTH